jgi:itaconate CoA-transferase
VAQRLEGAGIANAQVNTMAEVWAHPQLRARGRWTEVDTPKGRVPALLPPGSWQHGPARMDAVPALGQHTDAILATLGYSDSQIAALRTEAAI